VPGFAGSTTGRAMSRYVAVCPSAGLGPANLARLIADDFPVGEEEFEFVVRLQVSAAAAAGVAAKCGCH